MYVIMTGRNFFFIFMMGIGLISMTGCSFNGKNQGTFSNVPAVVGFSTEMGGTYVGTEDGYLSCPGLDNLDGDCILLNSFTINYDSQPSNNYFTISDVTKTDIKKTMAYLNQAIDTAGGFTFPVTPQNIKASLAYNGKIFLYIVYKGDQDAGIEYRLQYHTGEKDMYLLAKSSSAKFNDLSSLAAFDIQNLIEYYGRDSTYNIPNSSATVELRYLKVNLKYISKMEGGVPTYSSYPNPIYFAIKRE